MKQEISSPPSVIKKSTYNKKSDMKIYSVETCEEINVPESCVETLKDNDLIHYNSAGKWCYFESDYKEIKKLI